MTGERLDGRECECVMGVHTGSESWARPSGVARAQSLDARLTRAWVRLGAHAEGYIDHLSTRESKSGVIQHVRGNEK
jgi:hypothetical protein